jgi:hypothetical protein
LYHVPAGSSLLHAQYMLWRKSLSAFSYNRCCIVPCVPAGSSLIQLNLRANSLEGTATPVEGCTKLVQLDLRSAAPSHVVLLTLRPYVTAC